MMMVMKPSIRDEGPDEEDAYTLMESLATMKDGGDDDDQAPGSW